MSDSNDTVVGSIRPATSVNRTSLRPALRSIVALVTHDRIARDTASPWCPPLRYSSGEIAPGWALL